MLYEPPIIEKLYAIKLNSMAVIFEEQQKYSSITELTLKECLPLLIERQYLYREEQAFECQLCYAGLNESHGYPLPSRTGISQLFRDNSVRKTVWQRSIRKYCERALVLSLASFKSIKNMLKANQDRLPLPQDRQITLPGNVNSLIRGSNYYK